jgi:hypothetical protein
MDVQRYRSLVDMLVYVGDEDIVQKEAETFNSYLEKFSSPSDEMEAPDEDQMFQELLNSEDKAVNDTL